MSKRNKVLLGIALVVIVALVSAGQPMLAKNPKTTDDGAYSDVIELLEPYVSITGSGNIVLSAPKDVVHKVGKKTYQSILSSVELTNSMIDSGYLVCGDNLEITLTDKYLEIDPQLYVDGDTAYVVVPNGGGGGSYDPIYTGVTKVVWRWWGFYLYLDNATSIRLAAGLSVAAVICRLIPALLASTVATVVMAVGAGIVVGVNVYGRGIIMRFVVFIYLGFPVPILTGIWSQ